MSREVVGANSEIRSGDAATCDQGILCFALLIAFVSGPVQANGPKRPVRFGWGHYLSNSHSDVLLDLRVVRARKMVPHPAGIVLAVATSPTRSKRGFLDPKI